ncbi:hypothetical protein CDEST_11967 [Colletotrichum destructivum]|uniref:Uncharacterized protein n=1 Tax=Colletotrichum destructivum TaxID=34406 RepID=A0AAX4IUN3_9PEZI|nr:hypothetical protein CDEST_11967 [Colletotrichum destructivum]
MQKTCSQVSYRDLAERLKPASGSKTFTATVQPHKSAGREHWTEFSPKSQELSLPAHCVAKLDLWTKREAYLSLIPPMGASNNLPGHDAVIDLFFTNAASAVKSQSWRHARYAYYWLCDIAQR